MIVNTGAPRSIVGHAVSGAIIGLMIGGAYGYSRYKKGEIDKNTAIKNTLKSTIEGGIITASGIAASNAIGDSSKSPARSMFEALSYISIGIAGAYSVNNVFDKDIKLIKE